MSMSNGPELTRREFLLVGTAAIATTIVPSIASEAICTEGSAPEAPASAQSAKVSLTVNGELHELELDTRTTLLDALREHLHLTGTKKGCDHGQCGACTVLLNGRRINSCLTLAIMHSRDRVTTIEGVGTAERLHPMQKAFIEHDGFQCGYCTPGQICSALGMLGEIDRGIPSHVSDNLVAHPIISPAEMRERMSGNICRCGAYSNIIDAIADAAGRTA